LHTTKDLSTFEDLAHDLYIKLHDNPDVKGRDLIGQLKWLYRTAKNMFLDAKRREQTVIIHKAGVKASMLFEYEPPNDPYEAVLKIRELAKGLTEIEQLLLFTYLDLGSYVAIEKEIDVTRQTISKEIELIKKKMKDNGND